MSGSVPAQGQTLTGLGKQVNELISPDTSIDFLGNVTGTLKYVKGWTEFSSEASEQSGNYFPVHIDDKYKGKEITCNGEKETTAEDLDWVLLVKNKDSKFTFTCDGKTILTLSFQGATLAPAPVSYAAASTPKAKRAVKKKTET